MRAGDVAPACALLARIVEAGGTTAIETAPDVAEFARWYFTGDDLICCHVALDGPMGGAGQVAGFQWLGRHPGLPPDCADIATFTRRDAPLRGAGRALFAVSCTFARDAGWRQINATIRADNVPGLGYYSAMGFVDHAVMPARPLRDGTPVDRISKRLSL